MSIVILWIYAFAMRLASGSLRSWLRQRAEMGKEELGRLSERRGRDLSVRLSGKVIWLHAASVGEAASIFPVIDILRLIPDLKVLITTGTLTSAKLVEQRIRTTGAIRVVEHRYIPLDVPLWMARFIDHWQPSAVGIVESELWPNMLRAIHRRGIPMLLINARLSQRSYQRWQRVRGVAKIILRLFTEILAQSEADATRLRLLGAQNVSCLGNLKFAATPLPVDEAELLRVRQQLGDRPVWLAASTHPGEERIAVNVHRTLTARFPNLVTIIVPRHPQRGAAIADEINKLGYDLQVTRRYLGEKPPSGGIWLGDTLSELGLFYRLARVVFVGRSFTVGGGQNPIEPARLGCAVAMGPRTENFSDSVQILTNAGALREVADEAELVKFITAMLDNPLQAAAMGEAGQIAAKRAELLPAQVASRLLTMAGIDH